MPYLQTQVAAPLFMEHAAAKVYQVYRYDDANSGRIRRYTYTLDPFDGSDDETDGIITFDVRMLSTWQAPKHPPFLVGHNNTEENQTAWLKYMRAEIEEKAIKEAIMKALDCGELNPPGLEP